MNEEKGEPEKGSLLEKQTTVMMTIQESVKGLTLDKDVTQYY